MAQCCSAGNPVGGDLIQSSIGPHSLRLSALYKNSFSDQYYNKDHPEDVPQINYSRFNFMSFQFMYGISRKLNVFGELGYFFDKSQSVSIQGNHVLTARGIGDLALGAKYIIFTSRNNTNEFNITAGIKLPVGAFDQEMDGVVLPLSLQPSNGATKFTGSLYFLHRPLGSKLGFFIVSSIETSTVIQSKNYYYHYGYVFLNSISGTYKINDKTSVALQSRFEIRGKDKRENDLVVSSTGSAALFLSPIFQYSLLKGWELSLQADFPVYKYVQGYQLTNKYSFSVQLSKRLSFKKKTTEDPKNVNTNIVD